MPSFTSILERNCWTIALFRLQGSNGWSMHIPGLMLNDGPAEVLLPTWELNNFNLLA